MLRRDITPVEFVRAVRMCAGPFAPWTDNAAADTEAVRALFETEEERHTAIRIVNGETEVVEGVSEAAADAFLARPLPTPPAGSEEVAWKERAATEAMAPSWRADPEEKARYLALNPTNDELALIPQAMVDAAYSVDPDRKPFMRRVLWMPYAEVLALRAEFATLNEVAKANGALARSLRAEVEQLKGDREALLHSVCVAVTDWTEGADTVSLPTLTAHRLAAVAVKQALAIDAARTAGEGRDG